MKREFIYGLFLGVIVSLFVLYFVDAQGVVDLPFEEIIPEKKVSFDVADECGVVLGNVIHSIPDEDVCEQRCTNKCRIEGKEVVESIFTHSEGKGCHSCACSCR